MSRLRWARDGLAFTLVAGFLISLAFALVTTRVYSGHLVFTTLFWNYVRESIYLAGLIYAIVNRRITMLVACVLGVVTVPPLAILAAHGVPPAWWLKLARAITTPLALGLVASAAFGWQWKGERRHWSL